MSVDTPSLGVSERRNWWVRSRGWITILILVPSSLAVILSPPLAPEGSWTDLAFDFAGWIFFVVGAVFRWWATLYIGGRKLNTVVADGPYSICRNPLYIGTFLMGAGIAFFLQSATFAISFGLAAIFYLSVTVPAEEILLRDKFGQSFIDYCQKVPRYLPRLKNYQTPDKIEVNIRGLRAELFRCARWIWLPVLCEIIAELRTEEWWPRVFHLP